jgi:hypothetical protein
MAGGLWIIALQTTPTFTATLRSEVNYVVNFLNWLERPPTSIVPNLCALSLATWFATSGTTMLQSV